MCRSAAHGPEVCEARFGCVRVSVGATVAEQERSTVSAGLQHLAPQLLVLPAQDVVLVFQVRMALEVRPGLPEARVGHGCGDQEAEDLTERHPEGCGVGKALRDAVGAVHTILDFAKFLD